jgi:hypothetical protein
MDSTKPDAFEPTAKGADEHIEKSQVNPGIAGASSEDTLVTLLKANLAASGILTIALDIKNALANALAARFGAPSTGRMIRDHRRLVAVHEWHGCSYR